MSKKYVYLFREGKADMRNLLGGKGANLAEMTNLGLPVPQGFTVTTEACIRYYDDGQVIADEIVEQIYSAMTELEKIVGKKFGDINNPFLVSVRSGARASGAHPAARWLRRSGDCRGSAVAAGRFRARRRR